MNSVLRHVQDSNKLLCFYFYILQCQVQEIRFSSKGFQGLLDYYSHDIAVLILNGNIERSPAVMPACVHWEGKENKLFPDDITGKVCFTLSEVHIYSHLCTRLPFCLKITSSASLR